MAKCNFFISYTNKDKLWAEWIACRLEQVGFTTKSQSWDCCAGNYIVKIDNALINSDRYIIVLSPDYFASEWCAAEWAAALEKDPDNRDGTLVPVRVEECTPKGLLASIVYSDIVGLCEKDAVSILFDGINPPGRTEIKPAFPEKKASGRSGSVFPPSFPDNNLPKRNMNFTGRKDTIDGILKTFEGGVYGSPIEVITGPGGVGKSSIALEYAYKQAGKYDVIRWINAESPEALLAGYMEFAYSKKLAGKGAASREEILSLVKDWMAYNGEWLFIFDHAEKQGDIKEYVPASYRGNILITSECEAWGNLYKIPISVFRPEEAVEFFIKSARSEDREGAAKLSAELGFLPLALEQAAAYISNTGAGYYDYIEALNKYRLKIFEGVQVKPKDYDKTVAVTWRIALSRIKIESARQLLYMCSFFAGGGIEKSIFTDCARMLPEPLSEAVRNEAEFSGVIFDLSRYALIKNEEKLLSQHRRLKEAIRSSPEAKRLLEACFDLALNELDKFGPDTCKEFFSFFVHAVSIEKYAEEEGIARAPELYKKAIAVYEKVTGKDRPEAGEAYYKIGEGYNGREDYDKALEWYGKALAAYENTSGKYHPDTARVYGNIAAVYYKQGNQKGALELLIKTLVIYVKNQMTSCAEAKKALGELYAAYVNAGGIKEDFQRWLAVKLKEG